MIDRELPQNILERIEALESEVIEIKERLPCDHNFPHDKTDVWDNEEDCEVMIDMCRNCGERV
tara:strand:+ start:28496 stop:28684 length:189 start_codon:yes stop_codon:yes gene_type:complete